MGASSKEALQAAGITHILTVASGHPPKFPSTFKYKVIKVLDAPSTNLRGKFDSCIKFIRKVDECGGKVLVHCFAGVSRSATVVVAYLMKEKGMRMGKALRYVKEKRTFVNPNDGFRRQLKQYERELDAQRRVNGDKL